MFKNCDKDFVFSIHSGETNEINQPFDENIFTLINSNIVHNIRIGHGLSIWKYPYLIELLKYKYNIHIELAPLSNKILGYINDIKNHPGFNYLRNRLSVSINPDDPSFFGYNYVSYDWYEVIINWKLTTRDIWTLIYNSIMFSSFDVKRKKELLSVLWDKFKNFVTSLPLTGGNNKKTKKLNNKISKRKKYKSFKK